MITDSMPSSLILLFGLSITEQASSGQPLSAVPAVYGRFESWASLSHEKERKF